MAIEVTGAVLSDADRGRGEPVTFGYRGTIYEVELDGQDREALAAIFERYVPLAKPVGECSAQGGSARQ